MKVTFFGTTTLLFDDGKDQILFDAHFTRPSMLRCLLGMETDTGIVDEKLRVHHMDRLRAIFVSHSHHDHVMDAPCIAKKCGAVIYGSASTLNVARGGEVPEGKLVLFQGNETYRVGAYQITVIPSIHSAPTLFSNNLGQQIETPLKQSARLKDYKEGGSFDFYVEAEGRRFLIRPSFNYITGQLDAFQADVLFQGVAGLMKAEPLMLEAFYRETIQKVGPKVVIPIHWDNFFSPLTKPVRGMPRLIEKTEVVFYKLGRYCEEKGISCLVQIPGTSLEI